MGVGDVLARLPQSRPKPVTLPVVCRVLAELFEARSPKDAGMLAEVPAPCRSARTPGQTASDHHRSGRQRQKPDSEGQACPGLDGQVVNRGEVIVDGPVDPHDILRLQGVEALAIYIVQEVQEVYRCRVKINDKHIEVIIRQMLRRVVISDSGDSDFIRAKRSNAPKCWKPTIA